MVQAPQPASRYHGTANWEALLEQISARKASVGIMGLGYVGLPLATAFARKGFQVRGYDVSEEKVARLREGDSYVLDVPRDEVAALLSEGRLHPTSDAGILRGVDAIIICVPTPCQRHRTPDLSYIEAAGRTIAGILRPGQLIILESTTYPGTTEEILVPILEGSGLACGADFQVAFSPERVDPGNPTFQVTNTPKVVGGLGELAGELAATLYGQVVEQVVRVTSPREAEMAKLIENTFRHVNIALANELAQIARKLGVDIWQAIGAASTKPFGFMPFYPGPGVGGHCIPIDPHYLSWKAREMGAEVSFIELAERINAGMPDYVARMVIDAVNGAGRSIREAKILLVGLAYKPDIDDLRESPALAILDLLHHRGAHLAYHDPYVPEYPYKGNTLTSQPLTPEFLQSLDCAVVITNHRAIDWPLLVEHTPLIVDTRNCLREFGGEKIVRL